jgi:hypothetical protein
MATLDSSSPKKTTRLFRHLRTEPGEFERAKFALSSFALVLLVALICIPWLTSNQSDDYQTQLQTLTFRITDFATSKGGGKGSSWFDREAKSFYANLHGKFPKTKNEIAALKELSDELDIIATSPASEQAKLVSKFIETKAPILMERYPDVLNENPLLIWRIFGIIYWLVIFLLYAFLLRPAKGEPVFNVIDVAFLAILVEYSGGLRSWFILLFFFSLLLSAADFVSQEARVEYKDFSFGKKLIALVSPYAIALILHLFWVTSPEIMLRGAPVFDYFGRCAIYIVLAIAIWAFCRSIMQYLFRRLIKEPT